MSNESCLAMLRGFGHLFHRFLRVQEAFEIVAGFCRPKGENHRDTFFHNGHLGSRKQTFLSCCSALAAVGDLG